MSKYINDLINNIKEKIDKQKEDELYNDIIHNGYYYLPKEVYTTYKNINDIKIQYKEKIDNQKIFLNQKLDNLKLEINNLINNYKLKCYDKLDRINNDFNNKSNEYINSIDIISDYVKNKIENDLKIENDNINENNNIDIELKITKNNKLKLQEYEEILKIINKKFENEKINEFNYIIKNIFTNHESLINKIELENILNNEKNNLENKLNNKESLMYIKQLDYFINSNDKVNLIPNLPLISNNNQTILENNLNYENMKIKLDSISEIDNVSKITCSLMIENITLIIGYQNGLLGKIDFYKDLKNKTEVSIIGNFESPIKILTKIRNKNDKFLLGIITSIPKNNITIIEYGLNILIKKKQFTSPCIISNMIFYDETILIISTKSGYIRILDWTKDINLIELSGLNQLSWTSLSYTKIKLLTINNINIISIYNLNITDETMILNKKISNENEIINGNFFRTNENLFYIWTKNNFIKIYNINDNNCLNIIKSDKTIHNIFLLNSLGNNKKVIFFIIDKDDLNSCFKYANVDNNTFTCLDSDYVFPNKDFIEGFPKNQILNIISGNNFSFITFDFNDDKTIIYIWKYLY